MKFQSFQAEVLPKEIYLGVELSKIIGQNVQRLRKERGWTQEDVYKREPLLSQSRLSQIEKGTKLLRITTVQQLADIFGIEPFELLKKDNSAGIETDN